MTRRRILLVAAILVFTTSAVLAILLTPRLRCASLGSPEGTTCPEGSRIEFRDHGRYVTVGVDRRYPERFGIVAIGVLAGSGLLVLAE